jgi:acylglycerol lipase
MEGLPCFLFGESMGGAVALKAHLRYPDMWDGAILVAPMCKVYGFVCYPEKQAPFAVPH